MTDCDPGRCPRCGDLLEIHGTEPGIRRYWVCDDHARPVVILPPENIGWALTDARMPLTDPFGQHGPESFDGGVSVADRFCDRLETVYQGVHEHNRERHLSASDRDGDGKQAGLEAFAGGASL
ncbi:hypothetical protein [Halopiger xanaduensis]|uniref:hypothetical protein n=1 Tax=Halopiger xanaduensis TaxID=387343 RepID=UPI000B05AD9F|nr:hypothetical protein [Halopiger xanaduensis]